MSATHDEKQRDEVKWGQAEVIDIDHSHSQEPECDGGEAACDAMTPAAASNRQHAEANAA